MSSNKDETGRGLSRILLLMVVWEVHYLSLNKYICTHLLQILNKINITLGVGSTAQFLSRVVKFVWGCCVGIGCIIALFRRI